MRIDVNACAYRPKDEKYGSKRCTQVLRGLDPIDDAVLTLVL